MPQKRKFKLPNIDININSIGANIATFRKAKGLTQQELADKLGITQKLLSHYEVGRLKPNAEIIIHLAIALNTTADEILGLKNTKKPLENLSHSLVKKMKDIDKLPPSEKRALIKTIDTYVKANK